jgi:hypothetical protein
MIVTSLFYTRAEQTKRVWIGWSGLESNTSFSLQIFDPEISHQVVRRVQAAFSIVEADVYCVLSKLIPRNSPPTNIVAEVDMTLFVDRTCRHGSPLFPNPTRYSQPCY